MIMAKVGRWERPLRLDRPQGTLTSGRHFDHHSDNELKVLA